jgi:hypothetical protein
MQDSDFRPRALAEMAAAIRSDNGAQDGSDDMADLIALGGGLEALDAVIASLDDGQKFDPVPAREAQEMAHVMAALTDDLARAKAEKAAEKTETVTERVPELAT